MGCNTKFNKALAPLHCVCALAARLAAAWRVLHRPPRIGVVAKGRRACFVGANRNSDSFGDRVINTCLVWSSENQLLVAWQVGPAIRWRCRYGACRVSMEEGGGEQLSGRRSLDQRG